MFHWVFFHKIYSIGVKGFYEVRISVNLKSFFLSKSFEIYILNSVVSAYVLTWFLFFFLLNSTLINSQRFLHSRDEFGWYCSSFLLIKIFMCLGLMHTSLGFKCFGSWFLMKVKSEMHFRCTKFIIINVKFHHHLFNFRVRTEEKVL